MKRKFVLIALACFLMACGNSIRTSHWYDKYVATAITLKTNGSVSLTDYLEFRDQARGGAAAWIRDALIEKGFTQEEILSYIYPTPDRLMVSLAKK